MQLSRESLDPESSGLPVEIEIQGAVAGDRLPSRRDSIVIASFNIRYGAGSHLIGGSLLRRVGISWRSRRTRLIRANIHRAAEALTSGTLMPQPDILALQEADNRTVRAGGYHVAQELARTIGMSYAHAPARIPRGQEAKTKQWYLNFEEPIAKGDLGDTGIAVLSSLPVQNVHRVELPWTECAWRPRLAMAATFSLMARKVLIVNTHIDPHASVVEQLQQHEALLEHADETQFPTAILGDFNTLTRRSCDAMRLLFEERGFSTPMPMKTATWRSGPIRLHTDWIFTRDLHVIRWGVARPLRVSDHWPVWAEIRID
jgi:endonuclease/exonuclease/phosphatase family metal-dependent hydrolase